MPEDRSKLTLDYIKALSWPIIVVILIFKFASPLESILNVVPDVLNKAESIDIGKVSIKISKVLAEKATDSVRGVLKQLDAHDIESIISYNNKNTSIWYIDTNSVDLHAQVAEYLRCVRFGLFKLATLEERQEQQKTEDDHALPIYGFVATPLMGQTRDFLISLLPEILKSASK